jgi:hypothetical protein
MKAFFTQLNSIEMFYLVCAIVGSVFVFIRLVIQLAGMDHGSKEEICQRKYWFQ